MMITSEEIKKMKEKLGIIIKSYFSSAPAQNNGDKVKDVISAKMLQAAFEYLLRLPLVNSQIAFEFLDNLEKMVKCNIDFSLVLKAGVLLGLSEEYSRFKRYIKRNIIKKSQENKILQEMLETVKKHGFDGEICSSGLHITCPNEYKNVEEAILKIKTILTLEEKTWEIMNSEITAHTIGLTIYKRNLSLNAVLVKDKPFFHATGMGNNTYFFYNDKFADHENYVFYTIFQDHLLNPTFYRLNNMLYHYFCVKNGERPDNHQLEKLRMKYYRCIKKAYPRGVEIINTPVKNPDPPRYMEDPTIHMGNHPNIFYLSHRSYATASRKQAAPAGKLLYSLKDRSFFLMPGTRIVIPKYDPEGEFEYSATDKIYFSVLEHYIVKHNINSELLTALNKTKSAKEHKNILVPVAFVRKKFKINSPTLAAQLVLGYKRSGLKLWRNNKGQCLGDYLKEIGHIEDTNSKSESIVPADLE